MLLLLFTHEKHYTLLIIARLWHILASTYYSLETADGYVVDFQ
jgi:hypothetical protein